MSHKKQNPPVSAGDLAGNGAAKNDESITTIVPQDTSLSIPTLLKAIALHQDLAFDALDRCHNYVVIPGSAEFRKWFTIFVAHLAYMEILGRRLADVKQSL